MACPKSMSYGPCGGLRQLDRCEVDGVTCPFAGAETVRAWSGRTARPRRGVLQDRFIADLRIDGRFDEATPMIDECRRHGVTALFGEHVDEPNPISPQRTARIAADVGLDAIVTLTGRRSSAEAGLAANDIVGVGSTGILCVTGDDPRARFPDADPVRFGVEGVDLASIARRAGASVVCVGESPASGSHDMRAERVSSKAAAGADVVILNHCGDVDAIVDFAEHTHRATPDIAVVAPVPVITDRHAARALLDFPGLRLPSGFAQRIADGTDARTEGIAAAAEMCSELFSSPSISGVNLSGGAGLASPDRLEVFVEIVERTG